MRNSSPKKKKSFFLRLSLLVFAVYVIVMLVQLQIQIDQQQSRIHEVQGRIEEKLRQNEEIQGNLDHLDRYQEQQARKDGWGYPGEDVFKESP